MDISGPMMIVLIVLIAVGFGTLDNWMKLRAKTAGSKEREEDIAQLRSELAEAKRRIAALEKIATDPDARLASEIGRL